MSTLRRLVAAARAGVVAGGLLGLGLAIVTAATNGFHAFLDILRLAIALGLVFGALLVGLGLLAGIIASPIVRLRAAPSGPLAFAVTASVTAAIWLARWFEFEWAYPRRWPFVDSFGDMLVVAGMFAGALALAAAGFAWGLHRAARALARRGIGASVFAGAGIAFLLFAAGLLAIRPDPAVLSPPQSAALVPAAIAPPLPLPNDRRILVVGCDGAEWSVVDALLAEGELPGLGGLIARGVRAPLRTIDDRPSPALWTSIASSRRPDETGIHDFYVQRVLGAAPVVRTFPRHFGLNGGLLLRDGLGPRAVRVTPVSSGMVRTRRLWDILGASGVEVGVVGWLVTWPARAGDGAFVVSDRAWTDLREARAAGRRADDPGPLEAALWDPPDVGSALPDAGDDAWAREDSWTATLAERLIATRSPQVLLVYFRDVDAAEHLRWDEWEPGFYRGESDRPQHGGPVRESYLRFDRALVRLLETFGRDASVIVVSDHGHGPWFTWLGRGTPGGHTDSPDGIFVAAGPAIRGGSHAGFAPSVYDITPTVLRLAGLPVAADMEGRALDEILTGTTPLPVVPTYETGERSAGEPLSTETDEATLERLRALGYVR